MISDVVLPQMGLEVSEGTVTAVLVTVGQSVAEGETVAEVETDKAIAEIAATRDGFVTAIEIEEGQTLPVGATLMRIGDTADESVDATAPVEEEAAERVAAAPSSAGVADSSAGAARSSAGPVAAGDPPPLPVAKASSGAVPPAAPPAEEGEGRELGTTDSSNGTGRRRAAPIARRMAAEAGISLEQIDGTGPAGRITLGDVEKALASRGAAPASQGQASTTSPAPPSPGGRLEPLSATRQAIARRMGESQLVPQYTLRRDIDAGWLLAEKKRLSEAGPAKVGVVDLLLQALAETLVRHPLLAASFVAGADGNPPSLRHPDGIDLGLAVATDRGLLVPVLRDVHRRPLAELSLDRARLIETTRAGRLGLAEMSGAAATLSSLGTFGVDSFTAMLNPGESAILAVGRSVERAVPRDRGFAVVPTLALTFTFDHRVVDGAAGAAALTELAELLEGGMAWRL